jgi:hypothetical protein
MEKAPLASGTIPHRLFKRAQSLGKLANEDEFNRCC